MADAICPTFASGTISKNSGFLNDSALAAGTNGYTNSNPYFNTVGSFNHDGGNGCLDSAVQPVFRSSLVDFEVTGRQS